MIISVQGRGITKPVASVSENNGLKILRIDDSVNPEFWMEITLDSLEPGRYEKGEFVNENQDCSTAHE